MQTKRRAAAVTSGWDRKLRSMSCLPGHHTPETPAQCGAAATSRLRRPAAVRPQIRAAPRTRAVARKQVIAKLLRKGAVGNASRIAEATLSQHEEAKKCE